MNDLLSPTGQAIAAVVVAVFAGLIAVDLVWCIIRKLQRQHNALLAKAQIDAYLAAEWIGPVLMTPEQRDQMNAEKWNGD